MSAVYLDFNATAPLRPEVRAFLHDLLNAPAANPSSVHAAGRAGRALIDGARRQVASLIGAHPHEIVFTGSGTEACHLAIEGSLSPGRDAGGRVAALSIEHAAVMEPLQALSRRGVAVDRVPVGRSGRVAMDDWRAALRADTWLVVCMWANNETGVIQPVEELAELCVERGARLFVDATQAAGRIPIDLAALPIALLALSGHKLGGPAGTGALFVREGTRLTPVVSGGGQEMGLRGGTENLLGIAGLGRAAAEARSHLEEEAARMTALRERLVEAVRREVPGAALAGETERRLPNTAQFLVPHDDEEMLILALDRKGYAVSAGSACSAGAHRRSHVLEAMGVLAPGLASVRVSIGPETRAGDLDGFAAALGSCVRDAADDPVEARR